MSWLRLDDAFTSHPKFAGWSPAEKWALLELFSYCARYRTRGRVPTDRTLLPRSVTTRLLDRAIESGWLDQTESGDLWVHDWATYNPPDPTNAERQKRFRDRHARNGSTVTDAVTEPVTEGVTSAVTSAVTSGVTEPLPRARARARVPVPSPGERVKDTLSQGVTHEDDEAARHAAWEARAEAADVRSPTAFVRAGIASGDWPDPPRAEPVPVNMPPGDPVRRIAGLILNGVLVDRWDLDDELDAADIEPAARAVLVERWQALHGGEG